MGTLKLCGGGCVVSVVSPKKQQDAKTDAPVQLSSVESPDLLIFIFIFCLRNHRVISVGKDLQDHQVSLS